MNDPYKILNVSPDASDEEVKKAYRDLARKYHPDNYHDNPLADLAQEKMKEINAAYEEIQRARGSSRSSGASYGGAAYRPGYGGSSYGGGTYGGSYSGSSVLQQVRMAIQQGDLNRADGLLNAVTQHDAEWNFLKGTLCYRRGWLDEAKRYFDLACQMEPGNPEYERACDMMEDGGYRPSGYGPVTTADCGSNTCGRLCMTALCCNLVGGGVYCFPC